MSLASFHYAFDSRDAFIDELIAAVVAREQQAVIPEPLDGDGTLRGILESGLLRYLEHLEADPEHEQAMLELTPVRAAVAGAASARRRAQYARYAELAEQALERRPSRPTRRGACRSPRWRACSSRSPTDSPSPGSSIATTPPPTRSRMRPPTPSREWPTPMTKPDPARPCRARTTSRSPPSASRSAGSPPGGSAPSRPCGSASGWRSSRPVQLLLPAQIDAQLHPDDWVDSVVAFGVISGSRPSP